MTRPTPPAPELPVEPAAVVLRFLESVGRPAEARFYLELFRARPAEQFAATCIDANVLRDAVEAVVLDLRFLAALDLHPAVMLGLLAPAESPSQARRLRRRLERAGVTATTLDAGDEALAEQVAAAVRSRVVPIVAFGVGLGHSAVERFEVLGRLLDALATRKLIFLHRPGGLRQHGALVPLVNLTTDAAGLVRSRELSRKERLIVEMSRRLTHELVRQQLLVAITSPLNLLGELFTVTGAGTLMRRGASIVRHEGWDGVDRDQVRALLHASFGREPVDEFFSRPAWRVYREETWRGAAVLVSTPLGAYLTKFAVTPEARGEGIARDLWDAVMADTPTVFWRARVTNPIADWYVKLCDGMTRSGDWVVYWKGLAPERIPEAIASALAQPIDIPPAPASEERATPPSPGA